jgi:hypothetical protein
LPKAARVLVGIKVGSKVSGAAPVLVCSKVPVGQ